MLNYLLLVGLLLGSAGEDLEAQKGENPLGQRLQFLKLESNALRGNLVGDPFIREVAVLLPPSYFRSNKTQFPTVYLLHGLGKRKNGHLGTAEMFVQLFDLMKEGKLPEMILVGVDGTTIFGGSYYADSRTIGDFETYVGVEIVKLVESNFRARKGAGWRAVAGFSMGGYGAIKLGMKYSNVFGQVGSLSGSPLSMRYRKSIYRSALAKQKKPTSLIQMTEEITFEKNWSLAAAYAKAAAFSANPAKGPLFLDLPFESSYGEERDPVWQKWLDEDPLSMVTRYQKELASLSQIYLDHGEDETALGTEDFLRELVRYGIGHTHHIFRGDHVDHLFPRYVRMLSFLAVTWRVTD